MMGTTVFPRGGSVSGTYDASHGIGNNLNPDDVSKALKASLVDA